jgi:UDP-N-acetylglucosamine 1-carboxyvinyltransferase
MDRFRIRGGVPLHGSVAISGAKNAALPQMAAALLSAEPVTLENVPELMDIASMAQLLQHLGAQVRRDGDRITIDAARVTSDTAPYDLVRKMRASVVVLGPLLARLHRARVSLPGGCAIGARPVDLHIDAMRRLGAVVHIVEGYMVADAPSGLRGTGIVFEKVTVTGTENVMMAAALADGRTVLENCAMEPEVTDLGILLRAMGARIEGLGTPTIVIDGVTALGGATHRIIPDRIESGTYLIAGMITGGDITVENCRPEIMTATLDKLRQAGARLEISTNSVRALPSELAGADVRTAPYPAFATDMQAQFVALMTQAHGSSMITETIFENRFMHVPELNRMGAEIRIDGNTVVVKGKVALSGADVMATDLRASASLVIAGLAASGETIINRVYHIDRGYSHIVRRLRGLGARIERIH